jgi:transketolase
MSATLRVSEPGIGWTVRDPRELALRIRLRAVRMVAPQGFGYLGQALSSAEQVAAVFAGARPGVDRLVCSPGHYIIGPFAAAAELGLLAEDAVAGYGQNGSPVEAIGTERSPVVDYTCGSLGQGLSAALGFALADRFRGSDARIFTMVSDGELEEGQVWEAALFAAHHRLGRPGPAAAPDRAAGHLRRRRPRRRVPVREVRPVHQDDHRDDLVGARPARPGSRRSGRCRPQR